MALDSDVYWRYQNTTPSDWWLTPTFQNAGETTLPPDLILFNTVQASNLNSASSSHACWGLGAAAGSCSGACSSFSWHEDNAGGYSDVTRTTNSAHPLFVYNNSDSEMRARILRWGSINSGRSCLVDMVDNDITAYIIATSLRFGTAPWMRGCLHAPAAAETDWQWAMPFAPDWVWGWSNLYGGDEWHGGSSGQYSASASYTEGFAHRDGTYENWAHHDQDNQNYVNCSMLYSQSKFMDLCINAASYADTVGAVTWNDNGISCDWTNTDTSNQFRYNFIAGKNANSKVGNFKIGSDYGDGVYRSSDGTMKITTGFKPKMVFFIGGNRTAVGGSLNIQQGRGFASEADQWAQAMSIDDNDNTSDVQRGNWNNRCFCRLNYNSTSEYDYCSLNAMESDGFRVNVDNSGSYVVSFLALGDPPSDLVLPYQSSILSV